MKSKNFNNLPKENKVKKAKKTKKEISNKVALDKVSENKPYKDVEKN